MSLLSWFKHRVSPSIADEKQQLVERIEEETARLNGAVSNLTDEVRIVRKERVAMSKLFDDALQAMNKEYRK